MNTTAPQTPSAALQRTPVAQAVPETSLSQDSPHSMIVFADNRAGTAVQRRAIDAIRSSPHMLTQRRQVATMTGANTTTPAIVQREAGAAAKLNQTGLPENLKSGVESLSVMSMDSVKVHYNSDKPSQLNAHAYAQGNDIHVAPGQQTSGNNQEPVQRVIVRVGFNQAQMDSWNPFISGRHRAVSAKVNALPAEQRIYDYRHVDQSLVQAREGELGTELHVVGHGQPGVIAGRPGAELAQNIRAALGPDAVAGINAVRLHSCFSNVAPAAGNSAGAGFAAVFDEAAVSAATGIHYADTGFNLPPRFTGFKYGAQSAKQALLNHYLDADTNLREEAHEPESVGRATIFAAARHFGRCVNPMETFLINRVTHLYQGLDPQGGKTEANQAGHDRVLNSSGDEIDAMPPDIPYPQELGSLRGGLAETYHFTAGLWNRSINFYQNHGQEERVGRLQAYRAELDTAYQTCLANYQALRQHIP